MCLALITVSLFAFATRIFLTAIFFLPQFQFTFSNFYLDFYLDFYFPYSMYLDFCFLSFIFLFIISRSVFGFLPFFFLLYTSFFGRNKSSVLKTFDRFKFEKYRSLSYLHVLPGYIQLA